MTPRMRWLHEYYETTAEAVREYRDRQGCTLTQAKAALCPVVAPRLQYFDDGTQGWVDVPTVGESLGEI